MDDLRRNFKPLRPPKKPPSVSSENSMFSSYVADRTEAYSSLFFSLNHLIIIFLSEE